MAPAASGDSTATTANHAVAGTLAGDAASAVGLPLTFAKASDPSHGTLTLSADGSYTYTPAANFTGADSFTYTVNDGHGGTATATVTLTVADVAPTAAGDSAATTANHAVSGTLAGDAASAVGLPLTFAKASDPSHGTLTLSADGSYAYTPAANFTDADSFTYTVNDGHGGTATATVTIAVADVAPTAAGDSAATTANHAVAAGPGASTASRGQTPSTFQGNSHETSKTLWPSIRHSNEPAYNPLFNTEQVDEPLLTMRGAAQSISTSEFQFEIDAQNQLLIVQIKDPSGAALTDEVEILQADGEPLPIWVTRGPQGSLFAQVPDGTDCIRLKIVQQDSQDLTSTETFVTIYPSSGEIIAEPRTLAENSNTLTFMEQLKRIRNFLPRT